MVQMPDDDFWHSRIHALARILECGAGKPGSYRDGSSQRERNILRLHLDAGDFSDSQCAQLVRIIRDKVRGDARDARAWQRVARDLEERCNEAAPGNEREGEATAPGGMG